MPSRRNRRSRQSKTVVLSGATTHCGASTVSNRDSSKTRTTYSPFSKNTAFKVAYPVRGHFLPLNGPGKSTSIDRSQTGRATSTTSHHRATYSQWSSKPTAISMQPPGKRMNEQIGQVPFTKMERDQDETDSRYDRGEAPQNNGFSGEEPHIKPTAYPLL
ncbi:hypothetical protein KXW58_006757 [Aspergillus fumigatus]|nr:hypothetical protein KXW58_006757 [Aspergillus fumigatus]